MRQPPTSSMAGSTCWSAAVPGSTPGRSPVNRARLARDPPRGSCMRLPVRPLSALLVWAALSQADVYAESGRDAWLRYSALPPAAQARDAAAVPAALTVFESLPPVLRARDE